MVAEWVPPYLGPTLKFADEQQDTEEGVLAYYIVHLSDKAKDDIRQIIREELSKSR